MKTIYLTLIFCVCFLVKGWGQCPPGDITFLTQAEVDDFLNDYQSENFSLPYYTISIWDWYKTVAFKTKNVEFFSNFKQVIKRRNMVVPKELVRDILKFNQFNAYLFQDKKGNNENKKFYGEFKIKDKFNINECFNLK